MESLVFILIVVLFFAVTMGAVIIVMALASKKFRNEFINDWKGN